MRKQKFRKRNKLDIVLTDSRPCELPKFFSLSYFYYFLSKNPRIRRMFKDIKHGLLASNRIWKICGTDWHAAPLKFNIYKNRFEVRELSLISPISMIELSLFVEVYEKEMLFFASNEGFSVRRHKINENLNYLNFSSDNSIKYGASFENRIEASGAFYEIYPYKYITEFYNSDNWYKLNQTFRYFGKIDYSKCFDSIYSHSFSWIITKNTVDGKEYGCYQFFLNVCDKLMQNLNCSVTNGIVVGPEISRIMMEIIAQNIDNRVKYKLNKINLFEYQNYSICRFVDDIFIFADEEKTVETIIELYRDESNIFHLGLNEKKRVVGKLPFVWFGWKEKIQYVKEYILQTIFNGNNSSSSFIKCNEKRISNMKMLFQNISAEFLDYQPKITSYILSAIRSKVYSAESKQLSFFLNRSIYYKLKLFLDSVFYFYSYAITYNNTEKVISILYLLSKQVPDEILKNCLSDVLKDYSLSFSKANPEDIINLVLLLATYKIELSESVELSLIDKIEKKDNPLAFAVFLKYFTYNSTKKKKIAKRIETKIIDAINNINRLEKFFMYKEAWWLFVFSNCKLISKGCIKSINDKLDKVSNFLISSGKKNFACESQLIVLEFLLNDQEKYKFINWDIRKEELFTYVDFTTYERMLFNGYNGKNINEDYENY